MKKLAVEAILIPMEEGVAMGPTVSPDDRITEAIAIMLKNDLKRIAVTKGTTVMGMIRLEDALKGIGLEGELKSAGKRSIVVHGHKIIVNKEEGNENGP
jgi:CBS domain-containing protein